MQIRVLLFAALRELVGQGRLDLDVPAGATVGDVFDLLESNEPRLRDLRASTSFAVNREVVAASTELHGDDEIAFLQPVSGGS